MDSNQSMEPRVDRGPQAVPLEPLWRRQVNEILAKSRPPTLFEHGSQLLDRTGSFITAGFFVGFVGVAGGKMIQDREQILQAIVNPPQAYTQGISALSSKSASGLELEVQENPQAQTVKGPVITEVIPNQDLNLKMKSLEEIKAQNPDNYYLNRSTSLAKERRDIIASDQSIFEKVVNDPRLGLRDDLELRKKVAEMMMGIVFTESGGNSFAGWDQYAKYFADKKSHGKSDRNPAVGYGQIKVENAWKMNDKYNLGISEIPFTADSLFDKRHNLLASTAYFLELYKDFPDYEFASAAYYLGQGTVIKGMKEALISRLGEKMRRAVELSFETAGSDGKSDTATAHYIKTTGLTWDEVIGNPKAVQSMFGNQDFIENKKEITEHSKRYTDSMEVQGLIKNREDFSRYRNLNTGFSKK